MMRSLVPAMRRKYPASGGKGEAFLGATAVCKGHACLVMESSCLSMGLKLIFKFRSVRVWRKIGDGPKEICSEI